MTKYLVTFEFRYSGPPNSLNSTCRNKFTTIGVFDTIEEAIVKGNEALILMEDKFPLNSNYNIKQRFSKKNLLHSNLGYLITPFTFFAKIKPLLYTDLESDITEVFNSVTAYREYKLAEEDD